MGDRDRRAGAGVAPSAPERGPHVTTDILILGDGTGGLVVANLLAKQARRENLDLRIRLVGHSPKHTYQPGMLFLPFQMPGYRTLSDIQRDATDFVGAGVEYLCERITAIDPAARRVSTERGEHRYDWLVLALGCRTVVDAIEVHLSSLRRKLGRGAIETVRGMGYRITADP